jgi:hypothetical protein
MISKHPTLTVAVITPISKASAGPSQAGVRFIPESPLLNGLATGT